MTPCQRSFSCVLVSYPPTLKLIALGTLMTTSAFLVPTRPRCCTLRKLSRLVTAIHRIGQLCGPALRLRNILFAVCSNHAGLARRIITRIGGFFPQQICTAIVPHDIQLTRTPDCNHPVGCCSGSSGKTGTCHTLTRRVLRGRVRWRR